MVCLRPIVAEVNFELESPIISLTFGSRKEPKGVKVHVPALGYRQ